MMMMMTHTSLIEQHLVCGDDGLWVQEVQLDEERVHVAVVLVLRVAPAHDARHHALRPLGVGHPRDQSLSPDVSGMIVVVIG